ncbi:MAG: STAS domain-containing protein [Candidatus Aminicenantes bacterium]|nr:MAG: STAS domain-containing protein [Candidatus Aminicenantes bacterium]
MEIKIRKEENALIVSVAGRMDAVSAPEFGKICEEWIAKDENTLIIDFVDLDYLSSSGLRSLLVIGKKLKTKNGSIYLAALKNDIKEVFEISGFDSIFPIFESVDTALAQI